MSSDTPKLPIRISKVTDRYLLFDIDDIMYVRRHHNICSPFVGTMPQAPQQNGFLSLPIELMAEEAKVLVHRKVACIVDDSVFHHSRLSSAIDEPSRNAYMRTLKRDGTRAATSAREFALSKKAEAQKKKGKSKEKEKQKSDQGSSSDKSGAEATVATQVSEELSLFEAPEPTKVFQQRSQVLATSIGTWPVTPTTSGALLTTPPEEDTSSLIDIPSAYALYAHLHDKGYYMMPGLRFGCDYNVYPGDPLRFHSHFQATHYGWDEDINLLHLVTGGRLGTNVKKAYLIGGEVPPTDAAGKCKPSSVEEGLATEAKSSAVPPVRAFSIEWAAM
ncbi:tRNA-splicing endonuclease subunit sen34 [Xylariales sp. AK1849]|nr:tRNA-splicing endonuclease subunit sen34 [Xylariales sp. AK1849]